MFCKRPLLFGSRLKAQGSGLENLRVHFSSIDRHAERDRDSADAIADAKENKTFYYKQEALTALPNGYFTL